MPLQRTQPSAETRRRKPYDHRCKIHLDFDKDTEINISIQRVDPPAAVPVSEHLVDYGREINNNNGHGTFNRIEGSQYNYSFGRPKDVQVSIAIGISVAFFTMITLVVMVAVFLMRVVEKLTNSVRKEDPR
ncbi:hypothetical protein ONZ45_g7672 [Pleurotus djamor]|nr:hypothetical protein ONZ45_g7672 [Pleurotus djamor]